MGATQVVPRTPLYEPLLEQLQDAASVQIVRVQPSEAAVAKARLWGLYYAIDWLAAHDKLPSSEVLCANLNVARDLERQIVLNDWRPWPQRFNETKRLLELGLQLSLVCTLEGSRLPLVYAEIPIPVGVDAIARFPIERRELLNENTIVADAQVFGIDVWSTRFDFLIREHRFNMEKERQILKKM